MPIYMYNEVIDSFAFPSRDSGDAAGLVVTKSMDMTATPLFYGHSGDGSASFCDGSVRTVSEDPGGEADMGLLLPAVQGLLLPAVQHDFDLT